MALPLTHTYTSFLSSIHVEPSAKMFKKVDCLLLSFSTSAVYNNLAIKSDKPKKTEAVAVIHHDTVCIVPTKPSHQTKAKYIRCSKFTTDKVVHVTQVAWCNLGYETVLAITSTVGLQVFDQQGEECMFSHPCSDVTNRYDQSFARGIAVFGSFYFCVGNSAGCIRLFGPPDMEFEIGFIDRKQNHRCPIVDLSVYKETLASVDEEGYVLLWRLESEELVHKKTVQTFSHCTHITLKRDWFVATYGSGKIRIYNIEKESHKNIITSVYLSVEVNAHARTITGCDISEGNEYLLTVSEDSYVKVWQLYREGTTQMLKHISSIHLKDSMLMGCKYITPNGSKFCVSAYDSNIVTCYSL